MNTRSIKAVVDSIIRPNTCFADIYENPRYYFTSSVIIFAVAAVSASMSSALNGWYWNLNGQNYLDFSAMPFLLSTTHTALQNIVLIAAIFLIGKKLGGTNSFKKIFFSGIALPGSCHCGYSFDSSWNDIGVSVIISRN